MCGEKKLIRCHKWKYDKKKKNYQRKRNETEQNGTEQKSLNPYKKKT